MEDPTISLITGPVDPNFRKVDQPKPFPRNNLLIQPKYLTHGQFKYGPNDHERLFNLKNQLEGLPDKQFREARDRANPFEQIVSNYFMNRAATKLANIVAVFQLLPVPTYPTYQFGQSNIPPVGLAENRKEENRKDLTALNNPGNPLAVPLDDVTMGKSLIFLDLGAAPGSFTQYLQYLYPTDSFGYAFSLSPEKGGLSWNLDQLQLQRVIFNPTNKRIQPILTLSILPPSDQSGKEQSRIYHGDLLSEYDPLISLINQRQKLDLVVSDAAFESEGAGLQQENSSFHLFVSEILIICSTLHIGGHSCIKIFSSLTESTAYLIYLTGFLFQEVYLFKPLSSRPANSEQYLIGKGFLGLNKEIEGILRSILQSKQYPIFSSPPPTDWVNYLLMVNQFSFDRQIEALNKIIQEFNSPSLTNRSNDFSTERALLLWGIPK